MKRTTLSILVHLGELCPKCKTGNLLKGSCLQCGWYSNDFEPPEYVTKREEGYHKKK